MPTSLSSLLNGVRVTSEGHVYLTTSDRPEASQTEVPVCSSSLSCYSTGWSPQQTPTEGPLIPEAVFKAVWGSDSRVLVNSQGFPYSAVGRLTLDFEEKRALCTGALIGPSSVLTAAHCIYDRQLGRFARALTFSPAQMGRSSRPYGSATSVHFSAYEGFVDQGGFGLDLAVITLDQDMGYMTGWLSFGYDCGRWSRNILTAGYPGDLPGDRSDERGWYMYTPQGCSASVAGCEADPSSTFRHVCDTFGGQSGSPMMVGQTGTQVEGDLHIIGIHVGVVGDTNVAKQLTATDFQKIREWSA